MLEENKDIPLLYETVGVALSNWVRIEIQLHQLFGIGLSLVVMQPGGGFSYDGAITSAVLDSIDGFRAKLLMIDAGLGAALGDLDEEATAILNEWAVERRNINE